MEEQQGLMNERLIRVDGGDTTCPDTHVHCPVVERSVRLQRCAFCEHGYGLLLDSLQNTLRLRCGAPPGVWRET